MAGAAAQLQLDPPMSDTPVSIGMPQTPAAHVEQPPAGQVSHAEHAVHGAQPPQVPHASHEVQAVPWIRRSLV
jgi:hypothetical protein